MREDIYDPDNLETLPQLRAAWEQNRRADATQQRRDLPVSGDLADWLTADRAFWHPKLGREGTPGECLAIRLRNLRTRVTRMIRELEADDGSPSMNEARDVLIYMHDVEADLAPAVEASEKTVRAAAIEATDQALAELDLSDEAFERYRDYLRRVHTYDPFGASTVGGAT